MTHAYRLVCNRAVKHKDSTAKQKILKSAFEEMHLHGFQAASIANILVETGLTKGALYHHFPTKQALGLAVLEEIIRPRFEAGLFQKLRQEGEPVAVLINALKGWAHDADPEFIYRGCPLGNLIVEMSPIDRAFREKLSALLSGFEEAVEQALIRARGAKAVRSSVDCRAVASFIVSAWQGAAGISKAVRSRQPMLSCIDQIETYLLSLRPAVGENLLPTVLEIKAVVVSPVIVESNTSDIPPAPRYAPVRMDED